MFPTDPRRYIRDYICARTLLELFIPESALGLGWRNENDESRKTDQFQRGLTPFVRCKKLIF